MDERIEADLIDYVVEEHLTSKSKLRIRDFCEIQPPITTTVYRGHGKSKTIRDSIWHSASKSIEVAKTEFAGKNCCVFTIHLIDVPSIDINEWIGDKIKKKFSEEEEIIFLGGGVFYKDELLHEKGFLEPIDGKFECWYSLLKNETKIQNTPDVESVSNVERALQQIPEDEYELISTPNDIIISGIDLTEKEKSEVFNIIQRIQRIQQEKQKGGKNKKASKKHNKKSSKKHNKKSSKKQTKRIKKA